VPPREWRACLDDMVQAAERALGYVQGLTYEQFAADLKTIDAVSYAIVVIVEAASALKDTGPKLAPELPWADIRGMRNRVAHEYFGVDVKVLWETVREDLPSLLAALRAMLARTSQPP
jgi:uncharacterized protein with HEPN domain